MLKNVGKLSRLMGLVLAVSGPLALPALAETLRIFRGDIDAALHIQVEEFAYIALPEFCEAAVADPDIVDIAPDSETSIRVEGISSGRTSLTTFACEGNVISIVEILVASNAPGANGEGPFNAPEMRVGEQIDVVENVATTPLRLPASVSVILFTDFPSEAFEIADPDIADAASLGNSSFYILGKTVGKTTMSLQHEDGSPPTVLTLEITDNIEHSS